MHDRDRSEHGSTAGWVERRDLALLTDFYELTMMGGYHHHGLDQRPASFEYFFRDLPDGAGYAVFCGLEAFLSWYENLRFTSGDIDYLAQQELFSSEFLEYLRELKPSCEIHAPPEGTPVFPDEPLVRVTGPLEEERIAELKRSGAKINAWGVGTHLITSKGAPSLNGVYKIVAIEQDGRWVPKLKTTSNPAKTTDPGAKQVIRFCDARGRPVGDVINAGEEDVDLDNVPPAVHGVHRERTLTRLAALPDELKRLHNPAGYPALLSERLAREKRDLLGAKGKLTA